MARLLVFLQAEEDEEVKDEGEVDAADGPAMVSADCVVG